MKNIELGISIYPHKQKDIKKTKLFIDHAAELGFSRVFTSFLNVKSKADFEVCSEINKYAIGKGMDVIADVNPQIFANSQIEPSNTKLLNKIGVTGLRFDESCDGKVEAKLTNTDDFKVEINASSVTDILDKILKSGGKQENIIACHNFYPLQFTGLSERIFVSTSTYYKTKNVKVAAFVTPITSKNAVYASPYANGTPTLEAHRHISVFDQTLDLINSTFIDQIIMSQEQVNIEELKEMKDAVKFFNDVKSQMIAIEVIPEQSILEIEKDILFKNKGFPHDNRLDPTDFFIRSTMPRIRYMGTTIEPNNCGKKLKRGDVVILNSNAGHYVGEPHIIKQDIDDTKDQQRNLVAKVTPEDLKILDLVGPGEKFVLKNTQNNNLHY